MAGFKANGVRSASGVKSVGRGKHIPGAEEEVARGREEAARAKRAAKRASLRKRGAKKRDGVRQILKRDVEQLCRDILPRDEVQIGRGSMDLLVDMMECPVERLVRMYEELGANAP